MIIESLLLKKQQDVISPEDMLYAWGVSLYGQADNGITITEPSRLGSSSWTALSHGFSTSTIIRSDGMLFTWGINNNGLVGDGTTITRLSPVQIGSSSWTAVSTGGAHVTAIRSDGMLFA